MLQFLSNLPWEIISGIGTVLSVIIALLTWLFPREQRQESQQPMSYYDQLYNQPKQFYYIPSSSPSLFGGSFLWLALGLLSFVAFMLLTSPTNTKPQQTTYVSSWSAVPVQQTNIITLTNHLLVPVSYIIDDGHNGTIQPAKTVKILISEPSVNVSFEVSQAKDSAGSELGHKYPDFSIRIKPRQEYTVTNVIGDAHFFYPIVTNKTGFDCKVVVNEGTSSEYKTNIVIPNGTENVYLGYYRLFQDSNVSFHCGEKNLVSGIYNGNGESISQYTSPESGMITINYN